MAVTMKDIWQAMDKIDFHARAMMAANTEARSMLATLHVPAEEEGEHICPRCTRKFRTERALALHAANIHNGPPVPLSPEEEAA